MRIIISPTKKMNVNTDLLDFKALPQFLVDTKDILSWMRLKSLQELKEIWKCNDEIATQNYERIEQMNLTQGLTPAIISYEGIAFKYMAPAVFEDGEYDYVENHLRILSAFYGVLKPMDGVTPYRLEMQAKAQLKGYKNFYDYWGDKLYNEVRDESGIIINLASKEYSKCIEKYVTPFDRYITITFGEMSKGKFVTKGTYAKMARGDMVRYMAENHIEDPLDIKGYNRMGYVFREDMSSPDQFVFLRVNDD